MKWILPAIGLILSAAAPSRAERQPLSIAVTYRLFRPSSGATRDAYGSSWSGIGVLPFTRRRANEWRPSFDVGYLSHSRVGRATLVPVTFGAQKSLGHGGAVEPYVALRGGPYYGRVRHPFGGRETGYGFDANATVGVTFQKRFFLEARYDYFSRFAGSRFDGFTISGGIRVYDFGR